MDEETLLAATKGDFWKLKPRLDQGNIDLDAQDPNGRTLLHHAVSHGQAQVVEYLLRKDANALLTTDKSNTVLHTAVVKNDEALVRVILANVSRDKLKKLLDAKTKATGTAALHVAAKQNSHANVSLLLQYGANFEIRNNAGEKPIDLATRCELLELIHAIFAKAKTANEKFSGDLEKRDSGDIVALMNCRNAEGRTLMQLLLLSKHFDTATEILWLRVSKSIYRGCDVLWHDSCENSDADALAELAQKYKEFWLTRRDDLLRNASQMCLEHRGKSICLGLEKAHDVLLAYRKFEGKDKSLTANPEMKCLEEVLEVLGFDPERKYAVANKEDCSYYNKLPVRWKEDLYSLLMLMNSVVKCSVNYFLQEVNGIRLARAVEDNSVDKVQQLLDSNAKTDIVDEHGHTLLSLAVHFGNKKIVKLLLKSGMRMKLSPDTQSPLHLAIDKGNAKMVKLILKNFDAKDLPEIVNRRRESDRTALHVAAKLGRLDVVKILLRFGATYSVLDAQGKTPLNLSTSEEVQNFLKSVDNCFHDAEKANADLVFKLKAMPTDEFRAVAGTRNRDGQTLAVVAAKANAKNIAVMILKMMRELMEHVIYEAVDFYLYSLTVAQLFHPVKDDDVNRLQRLLVEVAANTCGPVPIGIVDHSYRTVLFYAAVKGNKKMVKG